MGALTPTELLTLWKQEQVTIEMSVGHLIQNQVKQQTAVESLTALLYKLRVDVDRLLVLMNAQADTGRKPGKSG